MFLKTCMVAQKYQKVSAFVDYNNILPSCCLQVSISISVDHLTACCFKFCSCEVNYLLLVCCICQKFVLEGLANHAIGEVDCSSTFDWLRR